MKSKIDEFNDVDFSEIISSSNTWKEIAEKFGYESTLSSNLKAKVITRCETLNIDSPTIGTINFVENRTKGDLFSSRKNWQSARTAIRKNAQSIFDKSDKSKECYICKYNKHTEIAHIKAVSEFSDVTLISEINNINNLIALCPNHHWEYDNGILKL